ncbi:MAG TPA: hypothetical protein VGX94_01435 [Terriglobia bacterium]|nr:hypothetical protein [Terriglobia bacterium]
MKKVAKIHRHRGWNTDGGQCGLEIFDPLDGVPVIVLTQLPWNANTSVTNMIETLAAEVALEYLPERECSRPAFRAVEHSYEWLTGDELFSMVTFDLTWPGSKKISDRPHLGNPHWQKITRQEFEALTGEPYIDAFRRVRQIAHPTAATLEAICLLRTHFSRLAKAHGPLAAALSRTDLPLVDPPESRGELYVTSLAEWLFYPEGIIGAKQLSDRTVASRWDVWELTRQLLLSVRQIAEIFLTHLELVHDRGDLARDLVEYFVHPEKLTVEIIQSQAEHTKLWSRARCYATTPWEIAERELRYGPREENHAQ